ncbi:MAG: hypothetical protein KGM16_02670 [Bacteroidota bacterium]|nr:hypothetical protein [Bacteroidota bacterium]
MRQTLLFTFVLLLFCGISKYGNAQGCVTSRSAGLRACLTKKQTTVQTGTYKDGDTAFADYLINLGYTIRF